MPTFKEICFRAACFLKLVDAHDGNLSLTNLALITCLLKLAITPTSSVADLGALLLGLAAYNAKKMINRATDVDAQTDVATIEGLKAEFAELNESIALKIVDVKEDVAKRFKSVEADVSKMSLNNIGRR